MMRVACMLIECIKANIIVLAIYFMLSLCVLLKV